MHRSAYQTPLLVHAEDGLAEGGRQVRNGAPIPVVSTHAQHDGRVPCQVVQVKNALSDGVN